jgi:hypothetical protein
MILDRELCLASLRSTGQNQPIHVLNSSPLTTARVSPHTVPASSSILESSASSYCRRSKECQSSIRLTGRYSFRSQMILCDPENGWHPSVRWQQGWPSMCKHRGPLPCPEHLNNLKRNTQELILTLSCGTRSWPNDCLLIDLLRLKSTLFTERMILYQSTSSNLSWNTQAKQAAVWQ